jgi:hypothetical protein
MPATSKRAPAVALELPGAAEVFNLAGERAEDGERVSREAADRARAAAEAAEITRRQQPELF